ncbi:MAG: Holliday junction resolvase RuvX [Acidobacteriota bacterium]|jgi:putative Holliday junction resolvase
MIWLALDLGSRRIGVAVSDDSGTLAVPLRTLEVGKRGDFPLAALRALVAERAVEGIVVGWPRRLDGSAGPEAEAAAAVAERLRGELGLPVELWDERLTSVEAERLLIEAGVRRKKRRGATDRIAATLILQGFLDHRSAAPAGEVEA